MLADYCAEHGTPTALSEAFTKGAAGAKELAEKVVELIAKNPNAGGAARLQPAGFARGKNQKVARNIYGAGAVEFSEQAKAKLQQFSDWGYGKLPVCIAKTQYSFTDDPKVLGAPTGWTLHVTRCIAFRGRGIRGGDFRKYHVDAGTSEGFAHRVDRRG